MDSKKILDRLNVPAVLLNGKGCLNILHITEPMRKLHNLSEEPTHEEEQQLASLLLEQESCQKIVLDGYKTLLVPEQFADVFGLYEKATYDNLTGVLNCYGLNQKYHAFRTQNRQEEGYTVVMFFDADHFGRINKTFGHHVGDQLLKAIPERLRGAIKFIDIVARYGGDEFLALVWLPNAEVLRHFIDNRIPAIQLRVCREPYATDNGREVLPTGVTLGWYAHKGELPENWEDLLPKASQLMLEEKSQKAVKKAG